VAPIEGEQHGGLRVASALTDDGVVGSPARHVSADGSAQEIDGRLGVERRSRPKDERRTFAKSRTCRGFATTIGRPAAANAATTAPARPFSHSSGAVRAWPRGAARSARRSRWWQPDSWIRSCSRQVLENPRRARGSSSNWTRPRGLLRTRIARRPRRSGDCPPR
jgi:hypothetical protein